MFDSSGRFINNQLKFTTMTKELIIKVSYDIYETYYGANQICVVKDDFGYYVLDTNSGYSSMTYRLKSDAVSKLRGHIKQYYSITKA